MRLVNVRLFPEDYYVVWVEREDVAEMLEIDEAARRVRVSQLKYLSLAQKLIIDSKLYQYVGYQTDRR